MGGHKQDKGAASAVAKETGHSGDVGDRRSEASPLDFSQLYDEHFDYVWRTARRLGVIEASVDDVVQDVFVVVHRRLSTFEGRSKLKTWLYGIVRRVVSDYHRSRSRRSPHARIDQPLPDFGATGPQEAAERSQANKVLHHILDGLDQDKREVFVLAEMEQMTAPEIAAAVGVNLNTVYSRLRAARAAFNQAVDRIRAQNRRGEL